MTRKFKNKFEEEFSTCSLRPPEAFLEGTCDMCGTSLPVTKSTGKPAKGRRWCSKVCSNAMLREHYWMWARKAALRRDKNTCQSCGSTWNKLEVNHEEPLVGRGYSMGCCHHQSNLTTQCKSCHVEITKAQIKSRKDEKNEKP